MTARSPRCRAAPRRESILIALYVVLAFAVLDSYYLALERGYPSAVPSRRQRHRPQPLGPGHRQAHRIRRRRPRSTLRPYSPSTAARCSLPPPSASTSRHLTRRRLASDKHVPHLAGAVTDAEDHRAPMRRPQRHAQFLWQRQRYRPALAKNPRAQGQAPPRAAGVRVVYVFEDAVAHDAGVQVAKDEQAAWVNAGLVDQRGVGDPADLLKTPALLMTTSWLSWTGRPNLSPTHLRKASADQSVGDSKVVPNPQKARAGSVDVRLDMRPPRKLISLVGRAADLGCSGLRQPAPERKRRQLAAAVLDYPCHRSAYKRAKRSLPGPPGGGPSET